VPRHSSRAATRPWSLDASDRSSALAALRPGRLFTAAVAALAMAMLLPLIVPPQRPVTAPPIGEELAGGVVVAAPTPSGSPSPAPTHVAAVDPGPDDIRSIRDAPRPALPSTLEGYQWPLPHGRLTLPFGPTPWGSRIVDGERFHDGIDIATFCGDRIVAAHAGRVLAVGRKFDKFMGWRGSLAPYLYRLEKKHAWTTLPIVVIVDDGNGYRSIYAHFSRTSVKAGQRVKAGQLIGYEGATGRASGCHLHYGLFAPSERATFRIDPEVVERMRVPAEQTARIDPLLVLPERPKPVKPAPTPSGSPPPAGHEGP
jgi:murein DD-endopeptidase MepM/ murein hydrolase activator NlpD